MLAILGLLSTDFVLLSCVCKIIFNFASIATLSIFFMYPVPQLHLIHKHFCVNCYEITLKSSGQFFFACDYSAVLSPSFSSALSALFFWSFSKPTAHSDPTPQLALCHRRYRQ